MKAEEEVKTPPQSSFNFNVPMAFDFGCPTQQNAPAVTTQGVSTCLSPGFKLDHWCEFIVCF